MHSSPHHLQQHIDAALDVMARHLGGPSGYDGRWRLVSSASGETIEIYLAIDEPDQLSLHVESRVCPLKFARITSVEQLDGLMQRLLPLCR